MEDDDKSRHVQMDREKELEFAVHKRDEVIQQLSAQLQHITAHNYSQEATQLAQQVQILQTQLQHAGKVLQSQTDKQAQTSHALQDATQEIVSLNQVITEKDSMMTHLSEKLDLISEEYTKLKESHESTKLREKQTNEVVQKLMIDAEEMRKQKSDVSNSNSVSRPSSPTSPTPVVNPGMVSEIEVKAKMEVLRSELEETYGLHIAQMKQAVVQQYQEEKVTLDAEMGQLKVMLEKTLTDNANYQQQLQQYVDMDSKFGQLQEECNLYKSECDQLKGFMEEIQAQNENYCQRLADYEQTATDMKELQEECALYKSQNDELKNKINSQQDSVVSLQSELDTLTSENIRLRDQMNLLSQDLDSQNSEIEEAFLEKNQYIEKAKKLEEEVGMLKSEREEFKSNSLQTEDMISSLKEALEQSETSRQKLEATILGQRDLKTGIKIDGVTSSESTDEAESRKITEEPISDIDIASLEVQTPIRGMPAESVIGEEGVKFYGQSTMCVQEEIALQNASLDDIDQTYNNTSVSSIPLEENLSSVTALEPNDSEATLTNSSCELSQSNSEQNQQYISQIEAMKKDVARLLDERTFALSEIEKLNDEILVLKDIGNKAEVELRELDQVKSENELFQREREEHLESNLTLMADVQSANLIIENLEKERIQLLANNESLEEKNKEINAKYEDVSVTNQRLSAELALLGQDQSALVLSQTDARQDTGEAQEMVGPETHEQSADQSHLSTSQANAQANNADKGPNKTKKDNHENRKDLEQEILQMQMHVDDLHTMRANLQEHIEHLRKEAKSLEKSSHETRDQQATTESVSTTEHVTDSANTTVNELMEKNRTLQEEKDLLNRKVSALEWQVTELHTKKTTDRLAVPVEEVMVQNFLEVEEAVGAIDPWTKPQAQSLSSQDSIEQEIMVQDSQNSMFLGQEVVEDMVTQTGFQGTHEMAISSRMSPDSIDQLDIEDHTNDISSDSIEQDVSRPETRLQERVRDSQCMLSVNPSSLVPSYSGGAGNSTCSKVIALDCASNNESVDSADSNIGSVDYSESRVLADYANSGDSESRLSNNFQVINQGCDSASQILTVLEDTSPDQTVLHSNHKNNTQTSELLVLESQKDTTDITCANVPLQERLQVLGENYDILRTENLALSSAKEDNQRELSSLHNECDTLQEKEQQILIGNSDLASKCETLVQSEVKEENAILEIQLLELKENMDCRETEKHSECEVENVLKSELDVSKREKVMLEDWKTRGSENVCVTPVQNEQEAENDVELRYTRQNDELVLQNQILQKQLRDLEIKYLRMEKDGKLNKDTGLDLSEVNHDKEMQLRLLQEQKEQLEEREIYGCEVQQMVKDFEEKLKLSQESPESLCINEDDLTKLKNMCCKLSFDAERLKEENASLITDKENLHKVLESKEKEREKLAQSLEENKAKFIRNKAKLVKLEKTGKTSGDIQQLENLLQNKEEEKQELKEKMENVIIKMVDDNTTLKETLEITMDKLRQEKAESENMRGIVEGIMRTNSELLEQTKNTNIDLDSLKAGRSLAENAIQILEEQRATNLKELEVLTNTLNRERCHVSELEVQCQELQMMFVKVKNDLSLSEEKLTCSVQSYQDLVEANKCEGQELRKALDREKNNAEILHKQFEDMKSDMEREQSNAELLEKQREDLRTELETERSNLKKQIEDLQKERSNAGILVKQCEDLKTDMEMERSKAGMLEKQNKDLKTDLEKEKSNAGMLEKQCEDLKTELEKERPCFEKQCENLKSDLEMERSNAGMLEKQCEDLKTDLEKEKSNAGILEKQNKDLKTELEKERLCLGKQCEDLKSDLEKEKSNAGILVKQCEDLKTDLEKEKSKAGISEKQCEDLKTELEKERPCFEKQCENLKTDLEMERSNAGMLEKQCEDLKTDLEKERLCLGKQCEDLKSDLEKEKSNAGILEKQNKDLKTELEKERSCFEKQCENLKTDLEMERSNAGMLEKQCEDLKTDLEKEKSNAGILEKQNKDLKTELEKERSCFEKQCENLKTDLEMERSKAGMLEKQCEDLKTDLEKEESNAGDLKTELEKEKSNAGILEKQNKDLKTELEKERLCLGIQCEDLKTELEKEKSNAGILKIQCEDLKNDLEKEKSNAGILEKQNKDLKTELEKEKSCFEKQYEDLKTDLEMERSNAGMLEKQCEDLKSDLEMERSNAGMLEKQCEDLKSDLEMERSNAGILEKQNKDLKTELEKEKSCLEKQCEDLKSNLEMEKSNTEILKKQIEDLKSDLEMERSNVGLLENQYKDLKDSKSALQVQLKQLEICCEIARNKGEEQEAECQEIQETLEKERISFKHEILSLKALIAQESDNYFEKEDMFAQRFDTVNKEMETLRIKDRNYEELQVKCNQLEAILEALNQQVERDQECHEMEKSAMTRRMEQERKVFQNEHQVLVSKCEKLQDALSGVEQNLDTLNLEYQTKFNDYILEKEEFEKDFESQKSELEDSFKKQYEKLEKEKCISEECFSKEREHLKVDIQSLEQEKTCLEDEIQSLKSDNKAVLDEKQCLEEKISRLQSDTEQKFITQEKFEATKQNFETQMEMSRAALETEIETLKKDKEELGQNFDQKVENYEKLLKDCDNLQQEKNKLVVKFDSYEAASERKLLEMKEESCFLHGQVEELQFKFDENVRKHSEEKHILEVMCKELQEEMTIKKNRIEELCTALDFAKNKHEDLERIHLQEKQQSRVSIEKVESANKENMEMVDSYKRCIQDLYKELNIFLEQVQDSDKQNIERCQEELTENRDFYQTEMASATEKLRQARNAWQSLNTVIERLKKEVDTLTCNKRDLLSQVESLKSNMTENDSMSKDFLSDLKSLTAERDGEIAKTKELRSELKLRNERCEKLIIAREQLLKELDASGQLQTRLEKENENIRKGNYSLIEDCASLKEMEKNLKQDLKQKGNNQEKLIEELKGLRNKCDELQLEKANVLTDQEMLAHKSHTLEVKNDSLEQEIAKLKETLWQLEQERNKLQNIHKSDDLKEMQHKYETVQSLMEDMKKECTKEIENQQTQLRNVKMTTVKSSLQLLEDDLNLSHEQKESLVSRLTQEENRFHRSGPGDQDNSEDLCKSQKYMSNQGVASGSQRSPAEIPVLREAQEQASLSGFFQVEPLTESDTVTHYQKCINDLTTELENVKLETQHNQESYQEEIVKLYRKIEDLEYKKDTVNLEGQNFCDIEASEHLGVAPQETSVEYSSLQVGGLPAQEQDDKIEAIVEERIARRMEGMKYEMEEKEALQVRSKEAEVADKYEQEFKKYKKEMEVYMKHKFEMIRAEKDTAFLKAMQKVNKDADKRVKKELEKQRLKLLEERANVAGNGSSDSGRMGSHIGDVVQKLHQENQDLAEARDALLQQVALSHQNQERLQEELCIMRGDEDGMHSDFPDNIPGDSVVNDGGDYIQESDTDIDQTKFSHHIYDSTSVMLDWELSPQASFDYGRDEGDSLDFVEHFECRRPRCRLIRQKFQELYDALPDCDSESVSEDIEEEFKPEDMKVVNTDFETNVELEQQIDLKEGSFHPEENHTSLDLCDSFGNTETSTSHSSKTSGFVESLESKCVQNSTEKCGFFLENETDKLQDDFLHHDSESPMTAIDDVLADVGVGFKPEDGFENVTENEMNIGRGARSEFLPEGDVKVNDREDMEDFIVDDVFESSVHETMCRETNSQLMSAKSENKTFDNQDIIPESLPVSDSQQLTEVDRFQPEVGYHEKLSTPVLRTPGLEPTEGFTIEADEFENEDMFKAGDGFKPERDGLSFDQDLVGDIMPITPTSELESELVREALRNAAQMIAPPYVPKEGICKVPIPEKVDSTIGKIPEALKRSKSAPSADSFIAESHEIVGEKWNQSVDCVTILTSGSQEILGKYQLNETEPIQGPYQQPNQEEISPATSLNWENRIQNKTVFKENKQESESETIERLQKDKKILEEKVTSLLKEKQSLTEKQREITLQLENETLSRQHFEQELLGISDNLERLPIKVTKPGPANKSESKILEKDCPNFKLQKNQDEGKLDLKKQVDSLESQVKDLLLDKNRLQHRCKDLEGMLRETQMVALKEKTELDKELESIEGRTLMLSSANQDLMVKCSEMTNMQAYLAEEKKQLLDEKKSLESHLNEIVLDNQNLQTTCHDLEDLVQRSKDASLTMENQLKLLEDNLCEMTAAKQELHLQCMEQQNRLKTYEGRSELKGLSREQKSTQTESAQSTGATQGLIGEESSIGAALKDCSTNARIEELEKHLKEKESYVSKLESDLEKTLSSSGKQKDFMHVKSGLEQTLREKDNYIRKLEEHFLRQGPFTIPISGPSMVSVDMGSEDTSSSGDSVIPQVMVENVVDLGPPQVHSTTASIEEDQSERDVELKIEDLAEQSLVSEGDLSNVSVSNLSQVSICDMNELSTTGVVMQSVPQEKNFGSKHISDKGSKLLAAISHSSPITSPRIVSPSAPSTCSNTGSFNSSERLQAGFITEEDGHLESKHSELVDEIARLRKDLSETKAIYTKENVLLKEALNKDGSSRDATKSKSSVSSTSFDSDSSQEVTRLRQKVSALEETNKMLQIENERWLRQIQDQEQVVLELRELLGRDVPNTDQTDSMFGKQITLLQNQRDHLLKKIHDFEVKNQRLSCKLGDNSILEESLRREKDLLYAKLCEKEDLERELSEKRLALERQRHSQEQLEEILYHKNITEKELMRQKRLLEEELTEIESKLQEKEELLERQKNTLLWDIKRRGSSPPKLLSGSFSVALNDDGSPASSTFYLEGTTSASTPKKDTNATPGELGRLELQVQEAERQHASAIQNLRQSLGNNWEGQQTDTSQRYRGRVASNWTEHLRKVPES